MEGKTLLIIDDDAKSAGTLADVLGGAGYQVYQANAKDEALNLVIKIKPAVIFVKAVLMDASGYEIIRDIRKWDDFAETPFVIMAAVEKRYDDRSRLGYNNVHTMKTPINADDALRKTAELMGFSGTAPVMAQGSGDGGAAHDARYEFVEAAGGGAESEEPVSDASERPPAQERIMSKEFSDEEVQGGQRSGADGYDDTGAGGRRPGDEEEVFDAEIVEDESAAQPDERYAGRRPGLDDSRRKALLMGAAAVFIVAVVAVVYFVFIKERLSGGEPVKAQQAVNKAASEANPENKEDVTVVEARPGEKSEPSDGREGEKTEGPEAARAEPMPVTPTDRPTVAEAGKADSGAADKHAAKPTEKTAADKPVDKPADKKETAVKKAEPSSEKPAQKEKPSKVKEKSTAAPKAKHAEVSEATKIPAEAPAEKPAADTVKSEKPAAEKPATDNKAEMKSEQKPDTKEASTAKKAASAAAAAKPSDDYRLQAGYFSNAENAKKLADNLSRSGYDVTVEEVAVKDGTRHRVMVGKYKSMEEALKAKDKLKSEKKVDALLKKG